MLWTIFDNPSFVAPFGDVLAVRTSDLYRQMEREAREREYGERSLGTDEDGAPPSLQDILGVVADLPEEA